MNHTKNKSFIIFLIISFAVIFPATPVFSKYINNPNKKVVSKILKPSYTVSVAKTEAFKDVKSSLPLLSYKSELTDKYYAVNMAYLNKKTYTSGDESRYLFPFYLGETLISYGVRYSQKIDTVYFYNSKGKLIRIEIDNNNPDKFPKKILTYNNKGKLHTVVLYISQTEQYNFDGEGNLIVHWIGERGFNKQGQLLKIKRSI